MESLRVLIDSGDPCPDCGGANTVYERALGDPSASRGPLLEWAEEWRECGHGCAELAAAVPAGPPRRLRPRRRVA